jgi:hypothetical protein
MEKRQKKKNFSTVYVGEERRQKNKFKQSIKRKFIACLYVDFGSEQQKNTTSYYILKH